jgi:arginine/serine-rich splicing factor 4/5/6
MTGFGFVEFENAKDAEESVQNFNGKPFMGTNIVVEFAKESRPRRDPYDDRSHGVRARRPPGIRIIVSGISRDTSWQDLKDFGRDAGNVSYADIDRDVPGQGILEYLTREDAERAAKELDGKDLRGRPVRVNLDDSVCRCLYEAGSLPVLTKS